MERNASDTAATMPAAVARKPPWLQSIKIRIIAFALAATIIPAITLGSLSYLQNTRFLSEKISQELRDATSQVVREIDLLVKAKLYDVRVFASSYIISENLSKILDTDGGPAENLVATSLIQEYLQSVRQKFSDYVELVLLDLDGRLIATSAAKSAPPKLPVGWQAKIVDGVSVIGDAAMDPGLKTRAILIADPIRTPRGTVIGALGAKVSLDSMDRILAAYSQEGVREAYLINAAGKVLASSHLLGAPQTDADLAQDSATKLYTHPGEALRYTGYNGLTVIGTLKRAPVLEWGVVVEINKNMAFAKIEALQRMTLALVGVLMVGIGLCAYVLGLTIVRPLRRLTRGADQVAAGNLDIDLPVSTHSEVGYLTQVFNHMVARLRHSREALATVNAALQAKNIELHALSITDELTGLYNRKHLMETLQTEVIRSQRNHHTFALLVVDIDHFKMVNDTYGHQKGDEVLRRLGAMLREAVRSCDYVARYGGEEFIVLLPEVGAAGGLEVAERIREQVARERINPMGDRITVSIGMSVFEQHGDTPEMLFQQADQALYRAKTSGRNRIATASAQTESSPDKGPIRLIAPGRKLRP